MELARSTVCTWHTQRTELVAPLVLAMWKDALASPYLCTDATGVLVQAKEKCRTGHFWVVVAPERHVLYAYSAEHEGRAVDQILGTYRAFVSLLASCQLHRLEPWAYLRDLSHCYRVGPPRGCSTSPP